MKKLTIIILIILLASGTLLFADLAVFLNSLPGKSKIVIDGIVFPRETPALLRNLSPGKHSIEFLQSGYTPVKINIDIKNNDVLIIKPTLEYQYIPMIFPTYDDIQINEQQNNGDILLLENGTYSFGMSSDQLRITPVYPGQRVINGLNISIPLLTAFSGAMTINEIYYPRNTDNSLSLFTLSTIGISAALIIADIFLYFNRNRYYKDFSPPGVKIKSEHPDNLYSTAEEMFAAGKLATSRLYLNKILNQFPESDIYPYTLYKLAKIKIIDDETDSAADLLKTVIYDYPLPDLYNSAVKSLADIFFREGKFQKSLDQLDLIIFMESGFTLEEIDLYRYKILNKWYKSDPEKFNELKIHIEYMIQTYSDSVYYETYVRNFSDIIYNQDAHY